MNLKEIVLLLLGIYLISTLLIAYKYYIARGNVYQISGILVFKYILRLMILVSLLTLCYFLLLSSKQAPLNNYDKRPNYLLTTTTTNSKITWNQIRDKVIEMPQNGIYSLIIYDKLNKRWASLIPATNQESFINLIENAGETRRIQAKLWTEAPVNDIPLADDFKFWIYSKKHWIVTNDDSTENRTLAKNLLVNWIHSSYVPLYLVILGIIFLGIDIIFSAKALKF